MPIGEGPAEPSRQAPRGQRSRPRARGTTRNRSGRTPAAIRRRRRTCSRAGRRQRLRSPSRTRWTNPLRPRPCVLPPRAPTSARPRRRAAWLAGHRANSSSSARRRGERRRHRRSHRRRRGGWRGDGRRGFTRTAAVQEGHGVGTGRDGDDEEECQRRGPPPLGRSVGLTLVGLLWHPITCPGPSVHGVTRARAGSLRLQPGHAHPTTARL